LGAVANVDKVWLERTENNDVRKLWLGGNPIIESFEGCASLGKEWVIARPVGKLGLAVSITSWPRRLMMRAHAPNDPKLSDGGAWRGACPTVERTEDAQM
jgi:hypothetical protein